MTQRLHLGCGRDYREGWINIDSDPNVRADFHSDLEWDLPFDDNYIDEVYARHIIEHVRDDVKLFNEIYRICKNGAKILIDVPDASSEGAHDWGHKSFWNIRKFHYLNRDNRSNHTGLECDFKLIEVSNHIEGDAPLDCKIISVVLEVVK